MSRACKRVGTDSCIRVRCVPRALARQLKAVATKQKMGRDALIVKILQEYMARKQNPLALIR